jgi:hypothetical protein
MRMTEKVDDDSGFGGYQGLRGHGTEEASHFLIFHHGGLYLKGSGQGLDLLAVLGIELFRFLLLKKELFQVLPVTQPAGLKFHGGLIHFLANQRQEQAWFTVSAKGPLKQIVETL